MECCRSYKHSNDEIMSALRRPEDRRNLHATVKMLENAFNPVSKEDLNFEDLDEQIVNNILFISEDPGFDGTYTDNNVENKSNCKKRYMFFSSETMLYASML